MTPAYRRYLKSDAWKAKRAAVIYRDRRQCRRCGRGGFGLDVHHLTYARLGNERDEDLITLCRRCHDLAHA